VADLYLLIRHLPGTTEEIHWNSEQQLLQRRFEFDISQYRSGTLVHSQTVRRAAIRNFMKIDHLDQNFIGALGTQCGLHVAGVCFWERLSLGSCTPPWRGATLHGVTPQVIPRPSGLAQAETLLYSESAWFESRPGRRYLD
jgi:hypothetical protein